ncbi:MAG: hypothetical protein WC570_02345 [Patescibacteria group bacterium]
MWETSIDVLYISLAVGFLVLIGFVSYVLLRLGNLVSDFRLTVAEVNHKLEMMDETVNLANDSLRMVNETLRNVTAMVDSLSSTVNETASEVKKVISMVSGISGLLTGLTDSIKILKKK